jgi:hypothetical protein
LKISTKSVRGRGPPPDEDVVTKREGGKGTTSWPLAGLFTEARKISQTSPISRQPERPHATAVQRSESFIYFVHPASTWKQDSGSPVPKGFFLDTDNLDARWCRHATTGILLVRSTARKWRPGKNKSQARIGNRRFDATRCSFSFFVQRSHTRCLTLLSFS